MFFKKIKFKIMSLMIIVSLILSITPTLLKAEEITAVDGETTYMILKLESGNNLTYSDQHRQGWYETGYGKTVVTTEWFDIEMFESFTFAGRIGRYSQQNGAIASNFSNTSMTYNVISVDLYKKSDTGEAVKVTTFGVQGKDKSFDLTPYASGQYMFKIKNCLTQVSAGKKPNGDT